jgi:hypothetical protein
MVATLVVVPADPAGDAGRGDVEQLVAVLTEPDRGPAGATTRWTSQTLTYRLELDGYPLWYVAEVHAAIAWGAAVSGLHVVPTVGPADVIVRRGPGSGAQVVAALHTDGSLASVDVSLGCCRRRPLWEDILQSFGPLGDRADRRSVFSQDLTRELPSCFDAAVIRTLYSLPSGGARDQVAAAASGVLGTSCAGRGSPFAHAAGG